MRPGVGALEKVPANAARSRTTAGTATMRTATHAGLVSSTGTVVNQPLEEKDYQQRYSDGRPKPPV